jgi:putative transposase
LLDTGEKRDLVLRSLLTIAKQYGWELEAWAVMSNHYHFVGRTLTPANSLRAMIKHFRVHTARALNAVDGTTNRKVWFNYWDTRLTFEKSYLARLNYVHQNPVHHGMVKVANQYPWCSAAWFERVTSPSMVQTIYSFKTERINVQDDF